MTAGAGPLGCPCDGAMLAPLFHYDRPPDGEVAFEIDGPYRRDVERCAACGHCVSIHNLDMSDLYTGRYVDATYGSGMRATFDRIVALPPDRSDNAGRVERLVTFVRDHRPFGARPRVLDVGSGLGVFPHGIVAAGWDCVALDPDARAVEHCRERGIVAVCGDFLQADVAELGPFDVVTFNKVLEHVHDPARMLRRAVDLVGPGGFVYVEVPDAEAARVDGPGREEFFIDHHHVFSATSTAMLAERVGMQVLVLETLREPSTKYTIRAFLAPRR